MVLLCLLFPVGRHIAVHVTFPFSHACSSLGSCAFSSSHLKKDQAIKRNSKFNLIGIFQLLDEFYKLKVERVYLIMNFQIY